MMTAGEQIYGLLVLALPVACVAWTVTHEEIFREPREWCAGRSRHCRAWYQRKFFYLFTCEYCFRHYVALFFQWLTGFRLLLPDWRGVLIGFFGLVWVANIYMGLFGRLRLEIKRERVEIAEREGADGEVEMPRQRPPADGAAH